VTASAESGFRWNSDPYWTPEPCSQRMMGAEHEPAQQHGWCPCWKLRRRVMKWFIGGRRGVLAIAATSRPRSA
jgi:hypothetical protein